MSWGEFDIYAPGRVNLLGEHTDYNGLPVLPMAIEPTIHIHGQPLAHNEIHAALAPQPQALHRFEIQPTIPPHPQGHWLNYVKAGILGVLDAIQNTRPQPKGALLHIDGTIPQGLGLSSSSALVVASALAFLQANEVEMDKLELAERMAEAEHYVGTRGGGMDQAACLLSSAGHVLKIDFFPLQVDPIPFSEDYIVVLCDSLIHAKKSEQTLQQYNLRALECRLGTLLIQHYLKTQGQPLTFTRLGDLRTYYSYKDLLHLLDEALREIYRYSDLLPILGESPLHALFHQYSFNENQEPSTMLFACGKRLRHVLNDAIRVEQCCEALKQGDYETVGHRMNQGHESARYDFEISCPELNHLTQLAMEAGALGSRLTGAGFGGCTVNLLPRCKRDAFIQLITEQFYTWVDPEGAGDNHIFSSSPGNGAQVITNL